MPHGARRTEESSRTGDSARESFRQIGSQVEELNSMILQVVAATNEETSASAQQVSTPAAAADDRAELP